MAFVHFVVFFFQLPRLFFSALKFILHFLYIYAAHIRYDVMYFNKVKSI